MNDTFLAGRPILYSCRLERLKNLPFIRSLHFPSHSTLPICVNRFPLSMNILIFPSLCRLVEGFVENEGVSVGADLEISSTVETGASSADDDENVPFTFDMSNRVSFG